MFAACKRIADSSAFNRFITVAIVFAGVLVGVETYEAFADRHEVGLHLLDQIVLFIFAGEVVVKLLAEGKQPWRYFREPWNVFDFLIVAACFIPAAAHYANVARLLRVLKLVRALPRLQLLVSALLKSVPSMAYVTVLLGLLFYMYGVAGVFLFSHNDPVRFPNLQVAMLTLFRVVTLEDWTDVMYTQIYGCAHYAYGFGEMDALCTASEAMPVTSVLFFVSFVLLGTMIVLNLFIGVIMNGMQEAHSDARDRKDRSRGEAVPSLADELSSLQARTAELQTALGTLARRASQSASDVAPLPPGALLPDVQSQVPAAE